MKTSYFGNKLNLKNQKIVSIAIWSPKWCNNSCPCLAPTNSLLQKYKTGNISWEDYKVEYNKKLSILNPELIYDTYSDYILLCWEKAGENCHRRLVAEWIEKYIDVKVPEFYKDEFLLF